MIRPLIVRVLDAIAPEGLALLDPRYFVIDNAHPYPDIILVRSTKLTIVDIPASVKAICRAGTGVDNLPTEELSALGIPVFYAPGANACSVAELTFAAILAAMRNTEASRDWVREHVNDPDLKRQVERTKKRFKGRELRGLKVGLLGLGAIGREIAERALGFGMEVIGYDPYLTVEGAIKVPNGVEYTRDLEYMLRSCHVISLHMSSGRDTQGMINAKVLAQMDQDGVVLVNYARGDLVVDADIQQALDGGQIWRYMHDFPTEKIDHPDNYATPHLGASTDEAEAACATQIAEALIAFFLQGEVRHSFNFMSVRQAPDPNATARVIVVHDNRAHVLEAILAQLPDRCNLEHPGMSSGIKGTTNIAILDVVSFELGALAALRTIPGVHYAYHINLG